MNAIRNALRLSPQDDGNGGFIPSPASLMSMTVSHSGFNPDVVTFDKKGQGTILVVCTEQRYLETAEKTKFSTGNHPIETLVPILYLLKAGFQMEVCTPTGKPVCMEMWAMPTKDEAVKELYDSMLKQLESPKSLESIVPTLASDNDAYVGVFIPGGHGALLDLPEDQNLTQLLRWVHDKDKYLLTICHGPAALLAAKQNTGDNASTSSDNFFKGYEIVAFPDTFDRITPYLGYMPGQLTWFFGEKLRQDGLIIRNSMLTGSVHRDRKLITGDSPLAANAFGKLCAECMLETLGE